MKVVDKREKYIECRSQTTFIATKGWANGSHFAANKADEDALIRIGVNVFPSVPASGYEGEDKIAPYLALGFQAIGQLRVWLRHPQ